MNRVLTIGNALVDVLVSLPSDALLQELSLPKGSMQHVDREAMAGLMARLAGANRVVASGGSAANTANGLANLGAGTSFIGMIGSDPAGELFRADMARNGITPQLLTSPSPTGMALVLVSPDTERTFAVHLGAAIELAAEHLTPQLLQGYHLLHIEGYLAQNHSLLERALVLAKEAGLRVSLDLASYNVVADNLEFLRRMVEQHVDIVFANEDEAQAYTGLPPEAALGRLASPTRIGVVKLGAQGSLVGYGDRALRVGVIDARPVDTTGAGDMYAAGFLYGLSHGLDPRASAQLGALLSGRVIEVVGPKLPAPAWESIRPLVPRIADGTLQVTR